MRHQRYAYGVLALAAIAAGVWQAGVGGGFGSGPGSSVPQARTASAHPRRPEPPRVTLDDLRLRRAAVTLGERDPFRFRRQVSVVAARSAPRPADRLAVVPSQMPVPQAPVVPIRFMGSLVVRNARWAIFSDCAGYTGAARPGESFLGEWEVLRIDEESVVVARHGASPTRIAMMGCAPR